MLLYQGPSKQSVFRRSDPLSRPRKKASWPVRAGSDPLSRWGVASGWLVRIRFHDLRLPLRGSQEPGARLDLSSHPVPELDAEPIAHFGFRNRRVRLIPAVGEDVRMQEGQGLAHCAVFVHGLDRCVDALEAPHELDSFGARHERLSLLQGCLVVAVDNHDEGVALVFRLLQVLDVSVVDRVEVPARYDHLLRHAAGARTRATTL